MTTGPCMDEVGVARIFGERAADAVGELGFGGREFSPHSGSVYLVLVFELLVSLGFSMVLV